MRQIEAVYRHGSFAFRTTSSCGMRPSSRSTLCSSSAGDFWVEEVVGQRHRNALVLGKGGRWREGTEQIARFVAQGQRLAQAAELRSYAVGDGDVCHRACPPIKISTFL